MALVKNLSCSDVAPNLWYSEEETDLFKTWLSHQVQKVRSHLGEISALLDEELITVDAATILGLEKYLSSELTVEYKERRLLQQQAVLQEHRWQRAVKIPHSKRLAKISASHSRWARERARASALFLEQDVLQELEEMMCPQPPRRQCSMPLNKDTTEEEHCHKRPASQRRWSSCAKS